MCKLKEWMDKVGIVWKSSVDAKGGIMMCKLKGLRFVLFNDTWSQ